MNLIITHPISFAIVFGKMPFSLMIHIKVFVFAGSGVPGLRRALCVLRHGALTLSGPKSKAMNRIASNLSTFLKLLQHSREVTTQTYLSMAHTIFAGGMRTYPIRDHAVTLQHETLKELITADTHADL